MSALKAMNDLRKKIMDAAIAAEAVLDQCREIELKLAIEEAPAPDFPQ